MMGLPQSVPLPRYGCCIRPQNPNRCKENHSRMSLPRGGRRRGSSKGGSGGHGGGGGAGGAGGHRRNLSAAFSFPAAPAVDGALGADGGAMMGMWGMGGSDLLNINTATEEELMTLPGINRQTAKNIVEYRRQIDGFRKVEDLALVSGVGATRLNLIRAELSVGKRGLSKNSSASSSGIDISMHDNVSRGSAGGQGRPGMTKVNVNTSNVFQLMKVRFLSQYLAENIVAYRDRKGPFASFDDLLKVKGIKPEVLSAIQPNLVLADDVISVTPPSLNGGQRTSDVVHDVQRMSFPRYNPSSSSSCGGRSLEALPPLGPLSTASVRSWTLSAPSSSQNGLRVASWNLDRCCCEKMDNPGVREVIAMTILENGIGIVAIQDLTDPESLQKLTDELTSPTLANIKSWHGSRGNWKYIVSPPFLSPSQMSCHLSFLYDTERDIQLTNSGFVWTTLTNTDDDNINNDDDDDDDDQHQQLPQSVPLFLAEFKVRSSFDITIANIYLEPEELNERLSEEFIHPVASILAQYEKQGSKNLLLTGHFGMSPECPAMASLLSSDFCPVLSSEKFTNISADNLNGSVCTENMWLSPALTKAHEGRVAVIRSGLTNPWIPNGKWAWGGTASSHCPIMTEFRLNNDDNHNARAESKKLHDESTDVENNCATFLIGGGNSDS